MLSQYAALGIGNAFRSASRTSKARYSLDAICRLLVCERIIDPGSKLGAWSGRNRYFFRCDFSDDDVHRRLDGIARAKDIVISSMNRRIARASARDMLAVCHDVTSCCFETDLRRKGLCKERRPDSIAWMGLLRDAAGIPIAYRRLSGNEPDCSTMVEVLSDMKKDHGLRRVVAVADKELSSSSNIATAIASGDGLVFSQSARGAKSDEALKAWVLDDTGYACGDENDPAFKSKSRQGSKTVRLKTCDTEDSKAKDIEVEVKYVALWSQKHAMRARHERQKAIDRAEKLIAHPGAYAKAVSHGTAR